jgi:protein-disulfide isomerase
MKRDRESQSDLTLPIGERDHRQGNANASMTLVEYGDYQCPHCGRAYPIIKSVQKVLGKNLQFVFRNFPLNDAHPMAQFAAESAEAAGSQGKFWEMHDALYENQDELGEELVVRVATELKLDLERFKTDLRERKFKSRVREDFMSGVRSGVNGTPGFFINGSRYDSPWDEESLIAALRESASRS